MEINKPKLEKFRGKWQVRWTDAKGNVRRKRVPVDDSTPESKRQSLFWEMVHQLENQQEPATYRPKVREYLDLYSTKKAGVEHLNKIRQVDRKFGHLYVDELDSPMIYRWELDMQGRGLKPPTIKRYGSVLKAALA